MSEKTADAPFREASEKVEDAHRKAVEELRKKVALAKAEALKKVSP